LSDKTDRGRLRLYGLPRNVILLGVVSFLADVSSEMVHPILPIFMAGLGATYLQIGLIEGLADSIANFLKVTMGWYSDKVKRRKPFIAFGYAPTAIMKPLLALASSIEQVLGIRAIERAGKGIRTAPRDALITDSTPPEKRGVAFGLHRALDSAGAIVGTAIALILIILVGVSSQMDTMRTIFVLSSIPAVISVLVVIFFVKEPEAVSKAVARAKGFFASLKTIDPKLKRFLIVVSIIGFANAGSTAGYYFFVLRAEDVLVNIEGVTETLATILLLYIAMNITYTAFSIPAGIVSDRIGRKPMIGIGLFVFVAAAVLMAFANSTLVILFGFLLFGITLAIEEVNQRAYASQLAVKTERGTVMGAYHTIVGFTALPAGLVFGFLWDSYGVVTAWLFAAVMALLAFVFLTALVKESKGQDIASS